MDEEKGEVGVAASRLPDYAHGEKEEVRRGSIVLGEAADLYGDIETAERKHTCRLLQRLRQ